MEERALKVLFIGIVLLLVVMFLIFAINKEILENVNEERDTAVPKPNLSEVESMLDDYSESSTSNILLIN